MAGPVLRIHFLTNRRATKAAIDYITEDGKALGQRYHNLPPSNAAAVALLERERWRSGRDQSIAHGVIAFPDGTPIDVQSAFAYLREFLDECGLQAQPLMAAAHAGRPHLHFIFSRVDARGRILPIRIRDMVDANRRIAERFALRAHEDRDRTMPADIVNAETWEGHLSFTRYMRGLPWPDEADPLADVKIATLLARIDVKGKRVGKGWRFERDTGKRVYRAKASRVLPAGLRKFLGRLPDVDVAPEPTLTYEHLLEGGDLILPPVRRHERFEKAKAAHAKTAKGLGYWVRRLESPPPTWTEEDRTPMYVLTRSRSGQPWRGTSTIADPAIAAELARRLEQEPNGFVDGDTIVAPNPLSARVLASLAEDQQFHPSGLSTMTPSTITVAIGGTLESPMQPAWVEDAAEPTFHHTGRDKVPHDRQSVNGSVGVRVKGPWLAITSKSREALLADCAEVWHKHESGELDSVTEHRIDVISHAMEPVERAAERAAEHVSVSGFTLSELFRKVKDARDEDQRVARRERRYPDDGVDVADFQPYTDIEALIQAEPIDSDEPLDGTPETFRDLTLYRQSGIVVRSWTTYAEVSHENFEPRYNTLRAHATDEILSLFDECQNFAKSLNARADRSNARYLKLRDALVQYLGVSTDTQALDRERGREVDGDYAIAEAIAERLKDPSIRLDARSEKRADILAALQSAAPLMGDRRVDEHSEREPDVIAPGADERTSDSVEDNVISPATPQAANNGRASSNGTHAANIAQETEALLALWESHLRDLGIPQERIDTLMATQRDAIAARAAAFTAMHSMVPTQFGDRLKAVADLGPILTAADADLAFARADAGVPIPDPCAFAFSPPDEYSDAVAHLPARVALGLQPSSSLIGMRAVALASLAPPSLVQMPNPKDPRGAMLTGFAVEEPHTRSVTTVLYDPQRGYVFNNQEPAFAQDAITYAILLAATQDSGAVTLSGTKEFKQRVADVAVRLGITVTNDRGRIQRMQHEMDMRRARHPHERVDDPTGRSDVVARDLGIGALDPHTCEDQRLTVVAIGSKVKDGLLTLCKTSRDELIAAALPADEVAVGDSIDIARRDGVLTIVEDPRESERAERVSQERDDRFTRGREPEVLSR